MFDRSILGLNESTLLYCAVFRIRTSDGREQSLRSESSVDTDPGGPSFLPFLPFRRPVFDNQKVHFGYNSLLGERMTPAKDGVFGRR